jgi:hypothetical protein
MEKIDMHPPTRVHIIPVGNAPVDRVLKPTQFLKPERVYLLTKSGDDAFAEEYKEIKQKLAKTVSNPKVNIIEMTADYYNLEEFMSKISQICIKESQNKNEIWFNISGGTMISVVGTLAALYYGVKPYFQKFNYTTKMLEDGALFPPIPHYSIIKPDEKLIRFLILMEKELKKLAAPRFPKRMCINLIKENKLEKDFEGSQTSIYNKLNSRYLTPLEKWGFISSFKSTHSDIEITQEGYFAMHVFGTINSQ